jgi:hypothetical protein
MAGLEPFVGAFLPKELFVALARVAATGVLLFSLAVSGRYLRPVLQQMEEHRFPVRLLVPAAALVGLVALGQIQAFLIHLWNLDDPVLLLPLWGVAACLGACLVGTSTFASVRAFGALGVAGRVAIGCALAVGCLLGLLAGSLRVLSIKLAVLTVKAALLSLFLRRLWPRMDQRTHRLALALAVLAILVLLMDPESISPSRLRSSTIVTQLGADQNPVSFIERGLWAALALTAYWALKAAFPCGLALGLASLRNHAPASSSLEIALVTRFARMTGSAITLAFLVAWALTTVLG